MEILLYFNILINVNTKTREYKNILIFFVKYQFINFLKYVSYTDNSHSSKKYIFFYFEIYIII